MLYSRTNERRARSVLGLCAISAWVGAALLVISVLGTTGCQPGVRWQFTKFEDAHQRGQRINRLTFAYFRSWYRPECTDFEDQVLADAAVRGATADMVCVPLDFEWDRPLAQRWELHAVPSFVIVSPDGSVLARGQAPLTRERLLQSIAQARSDFAAATRPAGSVLLLRTP